jgi:hypothetical protein
VRRLALDPANAILTSMPRLQAELPNWGADRFLAYMQSAEVTILGRPAEGTYDVGDLLEVWQIFEYVEVFMQRFDRDDSGTIVTPEALAAYPVYGATINQLFAGGFAPDSLVLGLFTFLLKYGNTPDQIFGGLVLFVNWQFHKDTWQIDAERDRLMEILAQLSKH